MGVHIDYLHCIYIENIFLIYFNTPLNMSGKVAKSYYAEDPVKNYCIKHSTPLHPVQLQLVEETLKHAKSMMMGAPEVISLNSLLIHSLNAKKVIDVGVFTGASSLAAALALPDDGQVIACDINEDFTNIAKKFWKEANVENKIKLEIAPATDTLQKLLDAGEENTFDFAFIDADKGGYGSYFELCLKLMRKGGIIAFDNTLRNGNVVGDEVQSPDVVAMRKLNPKLSKDSRVNVVLMNIGDGYTLATKL